MISRLLSSDYPRSRVLAAILIVILIGLAFAPFIFPGARAMNVAAKILVFIVLVASFDLLLGYTGIFSFAQIAAWTGAERDWVDSYLNFKGRIERDQWIRQAEALAKGGVAEYVRVFGRDPR